MPATVAEEWLNICGGCEVCILDIGEPLLDLLPRLQFVHMPVLMDHKYFGQTGEGTEIAIPKADVGIISGGIRNEKEKHVAEAMRKSCTTLIALGSCACFGGVPAMANMWKVEELYDKVYKGSATTEPSETPAEDLPPLLDSVKAVDEVVPVDASIPGCPTAPELIAQALTAVLDGKPFTLPERSVCDECPVKREKKASGGTLTRPLVDIEVFLGEPWEKTRCYMEQGFLCLGPVTRAGCGSGTETEGRATSELPPNMVRPPSRPPTRVPRCIKGHMPCRGCFGPIRKGANPLVDMMGAVSSIGLDAKEVLDRRALLNRYIGGQGRLRPLPQKPSAGR